MHRLKELIGPLVIGACIGWVLWLLSGCAPVPVLAASGEDLDELKARPPITSNIGTDIEDLQTLVCVTVLDLMDRVQSLEARVEELEAAALPMNPMLCPDGQQVWCNGEGCWCGPSPRMNADEVRP